MEKIKLDDYADSESNCYALANKINEMIDILEEKFTLTNKQSEHKCKDCKDCIWEPEDSGCNVEYNSVRCKLNRKLK
jgi:hypothetical protein